LLSCSLRPILLRTFHIPTAVFRSKGELRMPTMVLVDQTGPLPISINFKAPMDGPADLFISGSAFSETENSMIGIKVTLDGKALPSVARIYSNYTGQHYATVPIIIPLQMTFGAHTLVLSPATPETMTRNNDYFMAALMY
jgi:hypothetical protein